MAKGEKDYAKEMNALTDVMGGRLRKWNADGGTPWPNVTGATGPSGERKIDLNAQLLPPTKRRAEGE